MSSQHSGYSSPWGEPPHGHPLVGPGPPARPGSSASAGADTPINLNGMPTPGQGAQGAPRYGAEMREDSWGSGVGSGAGTGAGGGGEEGGDMEVSD